jgi:protein-tyrosine phosphatase
MEQVFWVIPERLGGRPGPDRVPWDAAALRAGGIGAVLSLNDGVLCHLEDFKAHDINYACMPLSDNAPPRPGDDQICLKVLPRAYEFVIERMNRQRGVLVHCSSGKDRTGLFLSYFLMQHDRLSVSEAIDAVRKVRPMAMSAWGWEVFAIRVLHQVRLSMSA